MGFLMSILMSHKKRVMLLFVIVWRLIATRSILKGKKCVIFYAFMFVSMFVDENLSRIFYLFLLLRNYYAVFNINLASPKSRYFV